MFPIAVAVTYKVLTSLLCSLLLDNKEIHGYGSMADVYVVHQSYCHWCTDPCEGQSHVGRAKVQPHSMCIVAELSKGETALHEGIVWQVYSRALPWLWAVSCQVKHLGAWTHGSGHGIAH